MAIIIPSSIPSKASKGEERLFSILRSKLPDNFYVWYEPRLTENSLHPDFIILAPDFGLLIIEVKGWFPKNIISATTDIFKIEKEEEDYKGMRKLCRKYRQILTMNVKYLLKIREKV